MIPSFNYNILHRDNCPLGARVTAPSEAKTDVRSEMKRVLHKRNEKKPKRISVVRRTISRTLRSGTVLLALLAYLSGPDRDFQDIGCRPGTSTMATSLIDH